MIFWKRKFLQVVENPAFLYINHVMDKSKKSVRKMLSSEQSYYHDMCSYHNFNQLYIPHDQAIKWWHQRKRCFEWGSSFFKNKPEDLEYMDFDFNLYFVLLQSPLRQQRVSIWFSEFEKRDLDRWDWEINI